MADRVFGAETEYAVAGPRGKRKRSAEDAAGELMRVARKRLAHLEAIHGSGIFLANGARLYIDCGTHPEYCTAECTDPWELVRQVEAGHRILAGLTRELRDCSKGQQTIQCFRCNVDYSGMFSSWGAHESYMMRHDMETLPAQLIPHLVTRPIYAGAGGFRPRSRGLEFTLAPRLTYFEHTEASNTTAGRGIWHEKDEPLSDKYHRVHLVCGESLCSQTSLFLKFGATALIMAMAEAGLEPGAAVQPADPVEALQTIIGDVRCAARLNMQTKGKRTAVEIQRHYLEMAEAHAGDAFMPKWAGAVCRKWREILDRLGAGPEAVTGTLDWAIKFALYERQSQSLGIAWEKLDGLNSLLELTAAPPDPEAEALTEERALRRKQKTDGAFDGLETVARARCVELAELTAVARGRERMFEIDMRFSELGPTSIFDALDRQGVLDHRMVQEEAIERSMNEPPATGRAKIRGEAVRKLSGKGEIRCDWQQIIDFAESRVLALSDPFIRKEKWRKEDVASYRPGHRNLFNESLMHLGHRGMARREQAYQRYVRGDYAGAEDLLRRCVNERFEVASNRCHLARVLLLMNRDAEARQEVELAWSSDEGAASYVIPRILYFKLLFAMLDGEDLTEAIERIKDALQRGACSSWTIQPMLNYLRPRLEAVHYEFLSALAAALSDERALPRLDEFVLWRA